MVDTSPSGPLRIALLSYRSKPHCGGQGVYVRHLSRELADLGHHVEVISGQPYPNLDPGPQLVKLPSLDLFCDENPFHTPHPREIRDWIDVAEVFSMWSGGFPEPWTFSLRAARLLKERLGDFDVVHDNQTLGYGMMQIAQGRPAADRDVHHPVQRRPGCRDRRRADPAAADRQAALVRLHPDAGPGGSRHDLDRDRLDQLRGGHRA